MCAHFLNNIRLSVAQGWFSSFFDICLFECAPALSSSSQFFMRTQQAHTLEQYDRANILVFDSHSHSSHFVSLLLSYFIVDMQIADSRYVNGEAHAYKSVWIGMRHERFIVVIWLSTASKCWCRLSCKQNISLVRSLARSLASIGSPKIQH